MSWTQRFVATVTLGFAVLLVAAGDVPRPRGVPLSRTGLYNPAKDFTCLDGSSTIPFGQVNDDYCDCFDGSDEPGTSACINGVFHCTNAGHRPLNIPSSRVNDGICDCCDGADEFWGSSAKCPDICEEQGREARAEAQRRAELLKTGNQIRQQLIEQGHGKKRELTQQLAQLEKDKVEAEQIKFEKEALKDELEKKENEVLKVYREAEEEVKAMKEAEERETNEHEAREIFTKFDSDADGSITVAEVQTRTTFDKNRDGQIDEEEAKYFLAENEQVDVDTFIKNCWSRIKPFLMIDQGMFKPPSEAPQTEYEDMEEPENEESGEGIEEHSDGVDDTEAEGTPQQEKSIAAYDAQTQEIVNAATNARNQYSEAERTIREIDSNIRRIKESLEKDYGPQQEFITLDGACFEYDDKEYIYKLCPFSSVVQKSKNGAHEVSLGSWGEWIGSENNRYSGMKYTGGQSCWNGPNRSTHVNVDCGLETKVTTVSEPSRCEYLMELVTPAACDNRVLTQSHPHDEL